MFVVFVGRARLADVSLFWSPQLFAVGGEYQQNSSA